jgi:microcystin-dependent protein
MSLTQITLPLLDPSILNAIMPTGAVIPFAGSSSPSGFLLCDGSAISRTTYATLFSTIGTTFGSGDGSTTFNIPNTQGIFVRGAGSQSIGGLTYTGTLGTSQNDATKKNGLGINDSHTHSYVQPLVGGGSQGVGGNTSLPLTTGGTTGANTAITLTSGDSETRPANISLNYIIKT